MIIETMTKEELRKELTEDMEWVYERFDGLRKKYSRQLKSRLVKERTFLGCSKYNTQKRNEVYLYIFKAYADQNQKYADLHYVPVFSYMHGNKKRYLTVWFDRYGRVEQATVFSSHSLDRLNERVGIDFSELIKGNQEILQSGNTFMPYHLAGHDGEYYSDFGPCILLARDHPWGMIIEVRTIAVEDFFHSLLFIGECFNISSILVQ